MRAVAAGTHPQLRARVLEVADHVRRHTGAVRAGGPAGGETTLEVIVDKTPHHLGGHLVRRYLGTAGGILVDGLHLALDLEQAERIAEKWLTDNADHFLTEDEPADVLEAVQAADVAWARANQAALEKADDRREAVAHALAAGHRQTDVAAVLNISRQSVSDLAAAWQAPHTKTPYGVRSTRPDRTRAGKDRRAKGRSMPVELTRSIEDIATTA